MIDHHFSTSTLEDARSLAPRVRLADREETQAFTGMTPEMILPIAVKGEGLTWTARAEPSGPPLAMFGVDPVAMNPELGIVWLVGCDELFDLHSREFLRQSRKVLAELHTHYPLLGNYVDARNVVHQRWLRWLGFSFLKLHPEFGVERRPFIQFARLQT